MNSFSNSDTILTSGNHAKKKKKGRNLIGFWIMGLCNNYAYVIMLSAAFDLLDSKYHNTGDSSNATESSNETYCNPVSTGAVLLADILPSLAIKLVAPFLVIPINIRVFIAVILSSCCFIVTSVSNAHWITYLGVICAALSSGLGEVTLLSFSSYFDKDVVSTWSSGTGGAGVIGALTYASLTHALSVHVTLQVMLIVPVLMAITFWLIIDHPPESQLCKLSCGSEHDPVLEDSIDLSNRNVTTRKQYTLQEKISLVKPLLKYMIPLAIVYFAEYFINQGLMELLYFPNSSLKHKEQYRWYQVDYQVGVFLSRSSVNFFKMKKLWLLPILQGINLTFLLCEAYYHFLPSIWIVLIIIIYEGLLGGCAYVNTFYKISEEVLEEDKEFSMGVASLGDSVGIALAGAVSLPVHDALCRMYS